VYAYMMLQIMKADNGARRMFIGRVLHECSSMVIDAQVLANGTGSLLQFPCFGDYNKIVQWVKDTGNTPPADKTTKDTLVKWIGENIPSTTELSTIVKRHISLFGALCTGTGIESLSSEMGEGTLGYSWSWLANLSNLLAKDMIPNIKVACETLQFFIQQAGLPMEKLYGKNMRKMYSTLVKLSDGLMNKHKQALEAEPGNSTRNTITKIRTICQGRMQNKTDDEVYIGFKAYYEYYEKWKGVTD